MKVLFVASEASPYSASGGLGDVIGSLPKEITKQEEISCVEVITPLYRSTREKYINQFEEYKSLEFNLSWRKSGAKYYKHQSNGVSYYFVENDYYFNRENLYGEYDDGERFAFFSKAVIELILSEDQAPDILHANDWQSALSIIYLKKSSKNSEKLRKTKTVFTIHNIEYQGKFGLDILEDVFGLRSQDKDDIEFDGCINLIKGGITLADFVTTVSPTYANELKYDFYSFGLSSIINKASDKLAGIINGIDYDEFSPQNDTSIYSKY